MAAEPVTEVIAGDGYAVASIDAIGDGYGFRKIRRELGVTAFGMNAIAMPPGYESGRHYHDEQEETYFVHRGTIEFEFGDGSKHVLGPGGLARVDAATVRKIRNVGDEDALYVIVGGKDGYVGRDGRLPEGEETRAAGPAAGRGGMSFIVYVILIALGGLVVGALARLALPGKDPMSLGQTMLVGIGGSLAAGLLADVGLRHAAAASRSRCCSRR